MKFEVSDVLVYSIRSFLSSAKGYSILRKPELPLVELLLAGSIGPDFP